MAATFAGRLLHSIYSSYKYAVGHSNETNIFIQTRNYAARKGTRAKKEALKRKRKLQKAAQKVENVPTYILKKQEKEKNIRSDEKKLIDDSWKSLPTDNVWVVKYHRWKIYSFEEAIQCHREILHPTMLNKPDANVNALIDLDLQGSKKTKTVSRFTRIINVPHYFDHGEKRTVMAFCKSPEMAAELIAAGVTRAGGKDLIKAIQAGEESLKTYEYCIAHPDIMAELLVIKGLMKKKFPTLREGTLSGDLVSATNKFMNGIRYTAEPQGMQKDYGLVTVPIGTLNMDTKHLEQNFATIINDVHSCKPKREGPFILRTLLLSSPSLERFKIDFTQYLPKEQKDVEEEEEEDDNQSAVIASH